MEIVGLPLFRQFHNQLHSLHDFFAKTLDSLREWEIKIRMLHVEVFTHLNWIVGHVDFVGEIPGRIGILLTDKFCFRIKLLVILQHSAKKLKQGVRIFMDLNCDLNLGSYLWSPPWWNPCAVAVKAPVVIMSWNPFLWRLSFWDHIRCRWRFNGTNSYVGSALVELNLKSVPES